VNALNPTPSANPAATMGNGASLTATAKFKTLLLREWMQHRRGWLIIVGLPFVVMLLAVSFGSVNMGEEQGNPLAATPLAGMLGMGVAALTLVLMWLAVLLQSSGLARRDSQDRSIEYWLSLPTSHVQSLSATLLAHLLLAPWFALACGLLAAAVLAPLVVLRALGVAGLAEVHWGLLLGAGLGLSIRVAIGILLATLWLSPFILGTMAASAWLKRWGVVAVAGFFGIGGAVEFRLAGTRYIFSAVEHVFEHAATSVLGASAAGRGPGLQLNHPNDLDAVLPQAVQWFISDLAVALRDLLQPSFVAVLVASAAMFWLLVLQRRRAV
jgi:ABC-2 type transport system permease protein